MIQAKRLLFLAVFILGAFQATAQTESNVYITKTDAKFHKSTCRYAQTGWAATLSEARKASREVVIVGSIWIRVEEVSNTLLLFQYR